MSTPGVKVTKQDGNTGAVRPQPLGNLAILACSQGAPAGVPQSFTRPSDIVASCKLGPLSEYGAYFLQQAGNPVVLEAPSTVSTVGTITGQGAKQTGSSVGVWSGTPVDEIHAIVTIVNGGTIGVSGITYTVSADGSQTTGPATALGTGSAIPIVPPVVGGSYGLTLTLGAGTVVAGDSFYTYTTRPQMNNSDLVGALEILRVSKLPWDNVLIDADASAAMVSTVDAWLTALEAVGVFKMAWMNTRHKNRPVPTTETESAYAAYLGTLMNSTSSINVDVGADGAEIPSPLTGIMQVRPTSLFVATRAESFPIGVDPAFVSNGPIGGGPVLSDTNGNPTWHDEFLYPGLDSLRYSTLRSFPGTNGVFITNANILSPAGSDYVYDQHARVMNAACTIAFAMLQGILSIGVRKQPPNPVTGAIYILEQDAQRIEARVNAQLRSQLKGQCNAAQFTLSRTDDLSPNSGATINGEVDIEALAYIKNFNVVAKYVKSIAVPSTQTTTT